MIERAYYRQAGTLSRLALPIFLLVRILINCSHFLYLPRYFILNLKINTASDSL